MRRFSRLAREGIHRLQAAATSDAPAATRPFTSPVLRAAKKQRHFVGQDVPPPFALTPEEVAARRPINLVTGGALLTAAGIAYYTSLTRDPQPVTVKPPVEEDLINWSGTHECHVAKYYQPESTAELGLLVQQAQQAGQKLRCVGSGLSPNALAFEKEGMVNLGLMDRVLAVDKGRGTVTVQAGARVQDVADQLATHGLSLQNYASIREQTMGGLTQVSAHGTGASIPPIDESVMGIKLVTPALGVLDLSKEKDPELFHLARVGLGCLGIVAELTLQCVPAHRLREETSVATVREVKAQHAGWLAGHRHLRYMWIPGTDAVVVVKSNPIAEGETVEVPSPAFTEQQRLHPLHSMVSSSTALPPSEIGTMTAMQCRDALLALDPLNPSWVTRVNAAEAEFWRRSAGERVGWSDQILGFDCGGEQWVLEVALPTGTRSTPNGADLGYMEELGRLIAKHKIPAPAPIEQRWSCGSGSPMSPAAGRPEDLFSWVGIIMYLPEDAAQRRDITAAFKRYGALVERELAPKYGAVEHWAKIEIPSDPKLLQGMRERLQKRYPLAAFAAARARLDPKNILGNGLVDTLLAPDGEAGAATK